MNDDMDEKRNIKGNDQECDDSPPPTPFGVIDAKLKQADNGEMQNIWIIDNDKNIYINGDDVEHSGTLWDEFVRFMSRCQYSPTISEIEAQYKFMILDRINVNDINKQATSYGMMINLDDMNTIGWSDNQIWTLIMDNNLKKLKYEEIDYNDRKFIWKNWIEWMQMVDVRQAKHLSSSEKEIDSWLFIQFEYYMCSSLFKKKKKH
eukprot:362285_1